VEYAQDHKTFIGKPTLEYLGRVEHLQHELSVFLALCERAAKALKLGQHLGS